MFNQSPWRRTLFTSAAAALIGSLALAGQTTVSDSIPLQLTNWNENLTIPQFNPALGTLDSISIRFEVNIEGRIGVENTSPVPEVLQATLGSEMRLFAPDLVTQLLFLEPSSPFPNINLTEYDGNTDFGGTSGFTTPLLTDARTGFLSVPPRGILTLAMFTGTGNVVFPASAQGNSDFEGDTGNEASFFNLSAAARLIVTYFYTGEKQPCEPNVKDVPGSLLLYPRFDNRPEHADGRHGDEHELRLRAGPGQLLNGTVDVEFVYIGRYGPKDIELDCLETNRTRRLTPCDTVTLLTRFDNPNVERGFLYVFAKDPQSGQAIVWNHLIGQALFIGGGDLEDDPARDALNARTFLGIGDVRTPTDHDGDGIRDLDGVEYSEAPDEILIPRFLGQDSGGDEAPKTSAAASSWSACRAAPTSHPGASSSSTTTTKCPSPGSTRSAAGTTRA